MATLKNSAGNLIREWRNRRRMSQLDLACEAEISSRHLSFLETGRSQGSREMLLHLAEILDIPLRDRNALLSVAGYAPVFSEKPLADPALKQARLAIERLLAGHEPFPALAIDRHWTLQAANSAVQKLLVGVDPELLKPPVNVLRLSLHPKGLAPRIVNYMEWRAHLLSRLRHQIRMTSDPVLVRLYDELKAYPVPKDLPKDQGGENSSPSSADPMDSVIVPLQIQSEAGVLSLMSTTSVFGTPVDVTLSELAIESFFPADSKTAEILRIT